MKIPALLTMLLAFIATGHAQQLDSLKYPNGYLYFHTYGAGAPVIVLSGGPGNSCLQQEEVAIELGKKYRAILPEQRGTGLSIPVPFDSTTITLQLAVEDLHRLLQHLHLKQAIFYGHSWGAMLAMSFAAQYPDKVRALVLVNPGYYKFSPDLLTTHVNNLRSHLGTTDLALWDSLGKTIATGKGTATDSARYNRTIRLGYIYNKSLIDSFMTKIYAAKPNGTMQELMVSDLNRAHYDLSKNLFHYKGPVSIIAGAQDALAFYTYELKVIRPAIQLYWIQESGHFPMFEQRTAFNKQLWSIMAAWP
ncbi:alpha/beta hydrolase [Chitinophaga polysaccharea]|uniref:alpha/beta fold hydrolase n=1 Tax=Chitinophaga polysaccharea TaxID=1293035 RepID=UPI00145534F0|nr:alpha/beta hydrolase [Chitinophaga polysaccharea]NLR62637.1 alpha/beta hydrolase [Chitinophaga polysaccharea]